MKLKRFTYRSTPESRAKAKAVLAHINGGPEPKGFTKRIVLNPAYIKQVRKDLHMTQRQFAVLLSVETSTVEAWEQGRRFPDNPVVALLQLLPKHPPLRKWLEDLKKEKAAV